MFLPLPRLVFFKGQGQPAELSSFCPPSFSCTWPSSSWCLEKFADRADSQGACASKESLLGDTGCCLSALPVRGKPRLRRKAGWGWYTPQSPGQHSSFAAPGFFPKQNRFFSGQPGCHELLVPSSSKHRHGFQSALWRLFLIFFQTAV